MVLHPSLNQEKQYAKNEQFLINETQSQPIPQSIPSMLQHIYTMTENNICKNKRKPRLFPFPGSCFTLQQELVIHVSCWSFHHRHFPAPQSLKSSTRCETGQGFINCLQGNHSSTSHLHTFFTYIILYLYLACSKIGHVQ